MECHILGKFFHILCLVATGYLFRHESLKYFRNEDSSLVDYRTFHETERDIYPSISICFYGMGIYKSQKLNETYGIEDATEYVKFLMGDIWNDDMLEIKFDDVTFDIEDRVNEISVMGADGIQDYLYKWVKHNEGTNDTAKRLESSSNVAHTFPLRTTYRHAAGKCFSLDLSVEEMPDIHGQLINIVAITFKTIRIQDINIYYIINYPGQILRGFVLGAEIFWNLQITSGHVKKKIFLLDIIEVFRKRSTVEKPCKENWKGDYDAIMRDVITMADCKPPHWNIFTEYPVCNTKEKIKNASIQYTHLKHASPTFLKQFKPPCHGILAATSGKLVEQHQNFSSLAATDGVHSALLGFHFKNERYKEIIYTMAFDFESLVGKVGGYIGWLLGFAFWQLPGAI